MTALILLAQTVSAQDRPNNKFGIHLAQPQYEDLRNAGALVNANGDWGYVTLVIQENDRDTGKWQNIFNEMRQLHLIPIIRIATGADGENWKRPTKDDAAGWVNFLNSLNWIVKKRYIILFNEPNHGSEWGGEADAKDYADTALAFAQALKKTNADYFIMLAGMDASAPQVPPGLVDEQIFLQTVVSEIKPDQFNQFFDGLSSHSYPNPGFVGSPDGYGRGSVRTYDWELSALKSFGIKDLPVFITETGWDNDQLTAETVGSYLEQAYERVWLPDERVIAVTPFVLNYQGPPFTNFSWQVLGASTFRPQYYQIQSLGKVKGEPAQIDQGQITFRAPSQLTVSSSFNLHLTIKNTGQAIWDKDQGYKFVLKGDNAPMYFFSDLKDVEPGDEAVVDLSVKTGEITGGFDLKPVLVKGDQPIVVTRDWKLTLIPLPGLTFNVKLFPKLKAQGSDFEVQVFDNKETLLYKKGHLVVKAGQGTAIDIQNIIPGEKYRVVILKPYYLPRQSIVVFKKGVNKVAFKSMFPLDFSRDGKLSVDDLWSLVHNFSLLRLLIP